MEHGGHAVACRGQAAMGVTGRLDSAGEEAPAQRDGGHVRSGDVLGGRHAGGAGGTSENGGTARDGASEAADGGEAGPSGIPEEAFPQSWPPASHRSHMPTVSRPLCPAQWDFCMSIT